MSGVAEMNGRGRVLLVPGHFQRAIRIQNLLVGRHNAEHDLLVNRLGGGSCALLEVSGAANFSLRLEGVERNPLA